MTSCHRVTVMSSKPSRSGRAVSTPPTLERRRWCRVRRTCRSARGLCRRRGCFGGGGRPIRLPGPRRYRSRSRDSRRRRSQWRRRRRHWERKFRPPRGSCVSGPKRRLADQGCDAAFDEVDNLLRRAAYHRRIRSITAGNRPQRGLRRRAWIDRSVSRWFRPRRPGDGGRTSSVRGPAG